MKIEKDPEVINFVNFFYNSISYTYGDRLEILREFQFSHLIKIIHKWFGREVAAVAFMDSVDLSVVGQLPKIISKKDFIKWEKEIDENPTFTPTGRIRIVFKEEFPEYKGNLWRRLTKDKDTDFNDIYKDIGLDLQDENPYWEGDFRVPGGVLDLMELITYAMGGFLFKNADDSWSTGLEAIQKEEGFSDAEYIKRLIVRCEEAREYYLVFPGYLKSAIQAAKCRFNLDRNKSVTIVMLSALAGVSESPIINAKLPNDSGEIIPEDALNFLRSGARNRWVFKEESKNDVLANNISLKEINKELKNFGFEEINLNFYESIWMKFPSPYKIKIAVKGYVLIPFREIDGVIYEFLPNVNGLKGYLVGEERKFYKDYKEALKAISQANNPCWWHPTKKEKSWKKIENVQWKRIPNPI